MRYLVVSLPAIYGISERSESPTVHVGASGAETPCTVDCSRARLVLVVVVAQLRGWIHPLRGGAKRCQTKVTLASFYASIP